MRIDRATYESGKLILHTRAEAAKRFVYGFKAGEYEIKRKRKRRSLDANAYLWSLCTKIAEAVALPKEEVYRRAVREQGVNEARSMRNDTIASFRAMWSRLGTGWFIDIADSMGNYSTVIIYYGSSVYDTKQMSRLLDHVIQDAQALDIETLSEREQSLLLDKWEGTR